MKQKRKALWGLIGISVLSALLIGGLSSYGKTASSKGNVSAATSTASQAGVIRPWTAVASTGTVDESAFVGGMPIFAFGPPPGAISSAGYRPGSTPNDPPIVLRYNVTNTFDNNANPNQPGWTTLELGSTAPPNTSVSATAYRVTCEGGQERLCTVTNANQPSLTNCITCDFAAPVLPIDFEKYRYYVEVVLRRSTVGTGAATPLAHSLRIY